MKAALMHGTRRVALHDTAVPLPELLITRPAVDEADKRLLELGSHDPSLPKPGEIVHIDFRPDGAGAAAARALEAGRPLRVVQWNIERGYELAAVTRTLAALDADVLVLQEIDVGCDRSDNRDVGTSPLWPQCAGLWYW
jgi:hypothetical protein